MREYGFLGFLSDEWLASEGESAINRVKTRMVRTALRNIANDQEQPHIPKFHKSRDEQREQEVYELRYLILNTDESKALEEFMKKMKEPAWEEDIADWAVELHSALSSED